GVVHGAVLKGLSGHAAARIGIQALTIWALQLLEDAIVVSRIANRQRVQEVLGGRAQQRVAADIDVLQGYRQLGTRVAGDLQARVQVRYDKVDRLQAVLCQLFEMARIVAQGEDPAVDGRV